MSIYADDMVLTTHLHSHQRLGDVHDWESPYSWPVRREFSRILHRPRPHLGIVYTERFLNSRPLTYFDDETKVIRARAGAILKAVHTPLPKPSRTLRPYETLDSYRSHQIMPYGVPQHIYHQSYYSEPAHLTIGRGHLACIQYAGGKGYPRRKNLYSDENRNIRDEIKFRSYYNRPKPEDANTLPTGFAWRLLHLPPKEEKAFKLYKHSRTLPSLMTKEDKENTSLEEDKDVVPSKRIHKTYTQPLNEPKTERSKVYSSPKESYTLKDSKLSKNIPENIIENPPRKDFETVCEKPEPIVEEKVEAPPAPVEPISAEEENTAFKKKKSKKEDSDKSYKRSLSHSKSVTEEKPAEIIETPKEIVEPADEPVINETVTEPPVEEIIEETALETPNEPEIISPSTKEEPEEIKEKETEIIEEKEIEKIEEKEIEVVEDATAPASQIEPEEIKPSEIELVEAPVESEQETVEPEKEPVLEVEPMESLEPSHSDSTPIVEEIDQVNEPDVESNQISTEASEEKEVIDEPVKSVSENTEVTENKQEEVDGVVICNGTESYTETRFGEDDDGELVITEVREETSDTTVEASSGQITHTVYSTTTETVIEAVDTTTQISEVPEDSGKPEEHINETDITTDDENVEVLSE